jgi:zinc protease
MKNVAFGSIMIGFTCLKSDLDELIKIIIDGLTNPTFSNNELKLKKSQHAAHTTRALSHPSTLHTDFRNQKMLLSERDRLTTEEQAQIISKITRKDLINAHKKYITAENLLFGFYGDIDEATARRHSQNIASKIRNKPIDGKINPVQMAVRDSVYIQEYSHDQVNIDFVMLAPYFVDYDDFIVMKVIDSLLGGSRGRLHNAVRGENDLAYFVFTRHRTTDLLSFFRVSTQTSIDKKDEIISVIHSELNKIKTETISQEEIERAVTDGYKTMQTYLEGDGFVIMAMRNETEGVGYDSIDRTFPDMLKVTSEDINRVAQKYFEKIDVIISQPFEE